MLDTFAMLIFWTGIVLAWSWFVVQVTLEQLFWIFIGSVGTDVLFGGLYGRFLNKFRKWRRYA